MSENGTRAATTVNSVRLSAVNHSRDRAQDAKGSRKDSDCKWPLNSAANYPGATIITLFSAAPVIDYREIGIFDIGYLLNLSEVLCGHFAF